MGKLLSGEAVRDGIISQLKTTNESLTFFTGNITKVKSKASKEICTR